MKMSGKPGTLERKDVQRRFARAARQFESADFVHRYAAAGLFERLLPMQLDAARVLDLGCAVGRDRKSLGKRFPGALVIGLDNSRAMLRRADRKRAWYSSPAFVQADAALLPLGDGSIDVVYANLLLPWVDDLRSCFTEIARVLRKDGAFVFSTLGPNSFAELRNAWAGTDPDRHVRNFPDMHDVGDTLVACGLRDPVLDVDLLRLQYHDIDRLFADLRRTAAGNSLRDRDRGLTGKNRFRALRKRIAGATPEQAITVTLELVYGHAWGAGSPSGKGEHRIAAAGIGRRRH
jgi:malonyl-CoA O-methyltransferase